MLYHLHGFNINAISVKRGDDSGEISPRIALRSLQGISSLLKLGLFREEACYINYY